MSLSNGRISCVTDTPCSPSFTSARTVIAMSRLRRHSTGSSSSLRTCATCDSGTTVPWRVWRLMSFRVSRLRRSSGTARATMSTRSSCSRNCDRVAPFITVWVTSDTSAGVRPSALALSWSSSTLSVRTGSFQSSWTSRTFGLDATTCSTSRAIWRTTWVSGPTTRNCTG
ncbi:hypothetical protein D3C78_987450 [compost metagenome]